ncbi:MAG: MFS transporter, partial [Burkholderiales bacterium 21-58-4]
SGQVVASVGTGPQAASLLKALRNPGEDPGVGIVRHPSGAVYQTVAHGVVVAVPLMQSNTEMKGAVVLQVRRQDTRNSALMTNNLSVLAISTLGAAIILALFFRFVIPLYELASAGRARLLVPLLILLLAQGLYAVYTIHTFRTVWVQVTRENTQILGRGLQHDLDRVLGFGIAPDHLRGVDQPMARLAASFPVISELRLLDTDGRILNRANAHGAMPVQVSSASDDALTFPLKAKADGPVLASLQILPDELVIERGVHARILDAATVVAVALVAAIELLLLLTLLMDRAFAVPVRAITGEPVGLDDPSSVGSLVRPVMFGFLFALALPLSFLPIYARSLLP